MPTIPFGRYEGAEAHRVSVVREDDATLTYEGVEHEHLQASIGGNDKLGYYLTFRGDPAKIVKMVEMVNAAAKHMLPRGRYHDMRTRSVDDG